MTLPMRMPATRPGARIASWADGRSLRWRLCAAFAVLASITATLGLVAADSVARSGALVAAIFDRALIPTSYARAAATGFAELESGVIELRNAPADMHTRGSQRLRELVDQLQADLAIVSTRDASPQVSAAGESVAVAVAAWRDAAGLGETATHAAPEALAQRAAAVRDRIEILIDHVAGNAFRQRQRAVAAVEAARWRTLIGTSLALLLGLAVAVLLARQIIRPVAAASRAAAGIADGRLDTPIPAGGQDELGHLLHAMTRMRDAIRATIEGEQAERRRAEGQLASALESSSEGVVVTDPDGRIAVANARAAELLPAVAAPRKGESWSATAGRAEGRLGAVLAMPPPSIAEAETGTGGWLRIARSAAHDGGAVAILSDITALKRHEAALAETNRRFAAALDNMAQGIALFDADDRLLVANQHAATLLRVTPAAIAPGRKWGDLVTGAIIAAQHPPGEAAALLQDWLRFVARRVPGNRLQPSPDGRVLAVSVVPIPDGGFVVTWQDVTERERAQARIAHLARHDALTGLPNRSLLRERLAAMLGEGRHFALHTLDLDDFRALNDSFGAAAGDRVLAAVGERLHGIVGDVGLAARLSSDEFAVILPDADAAAAAGSAHRIAAALAVPHTLDGELVTVGAHYGFALAPADGGAPDTLLRHAALACERARADGATAALHFHPDMDLALRTRRTLEIELRRALAEDALEVHYQPLVDCRLGTVNGFEALLRWTHPTRGRISPAEFIPVAEQSGLIVPLGEWVLRTATREATRWPGTPRVAVNVSPLQFRSARLADAVFEALDAAGLPPSRLEIEITESTLVDDADAVLAVLHRLREAGIRAAMDDFGTGYSSLATLRAFPFEKIKIDQSFVRVKPADVPQAEAIVRAVAGLAAALGMRCTAEGVETPEQFARLRAAGCTEVQGYFFGRPCPAAEVPALIARIEAAARIAA